MGDLRPGWYPYRSPNAGPPHKQDSWNDLDINKPQLGDRRYWDGIKWVGAPVPNSDLTGILSCPACERYTGFVELTAAEARPYYTAGYKYGLAEGKKEAKAADRYAFRAGLVAGAIFVLTGRKPEFSPDFSTELPEGNYAIILKCVDCSKHMAFCPICWLDNPIILGKGKCRGCDIEVFF